MCTVKNTLIALSFVLAAPFAAAAPAPGAADQGQFDFARHLFDGKQYFRAIGEFDRLLYFFPGSRLAPEALFLTGLAYYRAGQYPESRRAFGALSTNRTYAYKSAVLSADALFRQGLFEESRAGYSQLRKAFPAEDPDLLLSMSWTDLMSRKFAASVDLYDEILLKYPSFDRRSDVEYLKASALKLTRFRRLSPCLAASLSAVLPGAGQVYTRRAGDGLVAFGAVAFLGAGSWLLWRYYEHKEVAVVATLATAFFYGGNVYSAWSSAKKYNSLYYRRTLDGLRDNYWSDHDR
jgi:tetratricopeptide (TPR) repeat protein